MLKKIVINTIEEMNRSKFYINVIKLQQMKDTFLNMPQNVK